MEAKSYFSAKNVGIEYLESRPEADFGFDYESDMIYIVDENRSDSGLVNIQQLIDSLEALKESGANYVACDWHCDHQELEVHGLEFRKGTDEEIKEVEDKIIAKASLLKERQIRDLEEKLAKLKG